MNFQEQREYLDVPLRHYLASPSYFHKFMGATILQEWSLEFEMTSDVPLTSHSPLANELSKIVVPFLSSDPPACYHENLFLLNQLCSITNNSVDSFLHDSRLNTTNPNLPRSTSLACDEGSFTIAQARLAVDWLDNLHNSFIKPKKKKDGARIEDAKRSIREYIYVFEENKGVADIQVLAAFGAAAISLKSMPPKVTPLIKSIMNSLKVIFPVLN
jgi:TATA-binding protein-associated factor